MIKAVLFDMDGVLIDSELIRLHHVQGILRGMDVDMSDEDYRKFIGTTSNYMWGSIKNKYNLNYTVEELLYMERNGYFG